MTSQASKQAPRPGYMLLLAPAVLLSLILYSLFFSLNRLWSTQASEASTKLLLDGAASMPRTPLLNITYHRNASLAPVPLPPSHASSDGEAIIGLFQRLGRSTWWKSIANITFEGDTFEPEGILRLGPDRFLVSSGEYVEATKQYGRIINGTDRTRGQGFAHLMVYNGLGQRIADATITKPGDAEYHNGGIDFDGRFVWGVVGQYRPNSTAYVYTADPLTLESRPILRYADHLGAIVRDSRDESITCLNWGSRYASSWRLDQTGAKLSAPVSALAPSWAPEPGSVVRNPSHFIDYQDCKWLGHSRFYDGRSVMLCSGVAPVGDYNLGGVALVDVTTMMPLAEVPIRLESALGVRLTQNPVDASISDGKLRFYWMPDQHNSTLYVYEAQHGGHL